MIYGAKQKILNQLKGEIMSRIDWLDVATKCFVVAQIKELHVNDIAKHAIQLNLVHYEATLLGVFERTNTLVFVSVINKYLYTAF